MPEILGIEDDVAVLEVRCEQTGIPLWALIRVLVLRAIISDMYYAQALDQPAAGRHAGRPAVTLARSVARNTALRARGRLAAPVCIFASGVGNQLVDGLWFNRLGDHLALAHARGTLTVEDHFEWRWPEPRHNQRVGYHAPLQAAAAITGRVRAGARERQAAHDLLGRVATRAAASLGWEPGAARLASLVERLARRAAALPMQLRAYERLLARVNPKVLIAEEACYGTTSALLVAANRRGIRTAEYQHGVISAGHAAYNFAPALHASAVFRETLPADFLSFGRWWGSQVHAPMREVVIGNPHRSERVAKVAASAAAPATDKRTVLLLSDGTEFERYVALAEAVRPAASRLGLEVRIRPHPLERSRVGRNRPEGVILDESPDLYASLATAHVVVSEVSTGLFEAAGIADRILVWSTPKSRFSCPVHPFGRFDDGAGLAAALEDPSAGRLALRDLDAIWAPDWRLNYEMFLSSLGVPATVPRP